MTRLNLSFVRRFRRSEEASATIEFALLVPMMLTLCMSSIELGILMTRHVMLDRGVDLAVREVRLGILQPVEHDALVTSICENALIIPDCRNQLRLEMIRSDPRAWVAPQTGADCVNREEEGEVPRQFEPGTQNELMLLRACALFDPFFPTTGLGAELQRENGFYALVSRTSYVVEPQ